MDAMEVLKMATVNGAKAMRLNRADVLAKGKYAKFEGESQKVGGVVHCI